MHRPPTRGWVSATVVVATLLSVTGASLTASSSASEPIDVIFLSDIHVDMYFGSPEGLSPCNTSASNSDTPYGAWDCDAPPRLAVSAWDDVAARFGASSGGHVVVAGDWLRHKSNLLSEEQNADAFRWVTSLARTSISKTAAMLHAAPSVDASLAFGNNDVVPDYYFPYRNATPPPLFANMTGSLLEEGLLSEDEHAVFSKCAFYSRVTEQGRLRIVVLNSLLWDLSLAPEPAHGEDPCGQFAFLEGELATARTAGQAVWIVSHIPPTVNTYDVAAHPGCNATDTHAYFWQRPYERRYWSIVTGNNDIIRVQLYAHTHHFGFNADDFVGVPLYILGAISPVYRNWPNYFHLQVDPVTFVPLSMRQRHFNLTSFQWSYGLDLFSAYNTSGPGGRAPTAPQAVSTMRRVADQLLTNASAWETYRLMHAGGIIMDDCTTRYCRSVSACFISTAGTEGFFRCLATVDADDEG